LRILFHDLRVALAEHLGYPLIGYSSGTQPSGICRTKVVDSKVRNLCPSKSFPPKNPGPVTAPEAPKRSRMPDWYTAGNSECRSQRHSECHSTNLYFGTLW
jgi:hypothetical protein